MNKGILVILDGYGEGKKYEYNAVENAKSPTLKNLKKQSYSLLKTDSEAVGLLKNDLGGSEVGHMTIGAGRVVDSVAKKIQDDIKNDELKHNATFSKTMLNLKKNKADLHLIGLMSDKNVHSNIYHLLAIIDIAKNYAKNIYIHFITDGRDSGAYESIKYYKLLNSKIKNIDICEILSVMGRFYAMDRENNLDKTELSYKTMFFSGEKISSSSILDYLKKQHKIGNNDQMIEPIGVENKTYSGVKKNDYLLFFNFREDRLRQIVKKCEDLKCNLVTMAEVQNTKAEAMYCSNKVSNTLSEYLSKLGLKQIKIAETTKYAHVTYFLNGGEEKPFENEDRVFIKTKKVDVFSKTPKMQAGKITKSVIKSIKSNYDAIVVNYSNPDMVGHTGDYEATVKAIEYVDSCLKKVLNVAQKNNYFVLVTADHGNSEEMRTNNNEPHLAHTLNRVFCVVANSGLKMKKYGELKDVAPTFLDLMDVKPNKSMQGKSLIIKNIDRSE